VKNRCKNEKCFSMKKLEIIYFFMIKLEKKNYIYPGTCNKVKFTLQYEILDQT
jgi:hypothetical protein